MRRSKRIGSAEDGAKHGVVRSGRGDEMLTSDYRYEQKKATSQYIATAKNVGYLREEGG